MTTLQVDSIRNVAGTLLNTCVQLVQFSSTSVFESTATTEFDMPSPFGDFSMSITPRYANSVFHINYVMQCGQEDTWRGNGFRLYYRVGSGGSVIQHTAGGAYGYTWTSSWNGNMNPAVANFIFPSQGSLTPIFFKLTQDGHDNGAFLHFNQNNNTNTGAANNFVSVASTFTIMEILQ
jgi:hypothetical protein